MARFVRADQVNEQSLVDGNTKWAASRASLAPFGEYFFMAVFTGVFDDVGICLFEAAFQQSDRMGFTVAGIPGDDDGPPARTILRITSSREVLTFNSRRRVMRTSSL